MDSLTTLLAGAGGVFGANLLDPIAWLLANLICRRASSRWLPIAALLIWKAVVLAAISTTDALPSGVNLQFIIGFALSAWFIAHVSFKLRQASQPKVIS